ncbi:phosphomethylpyrimidine synthase ThiC [Streptomyces sp. LN704]|uniref:phosphomethylpyrimidine synthase ThiC n=1 Tax=unclassified Streptomyces TaxID=2593676 RepID=UPI00370F8E91
MNPQQHAAPTGDAQSARSFVIRSAGHDIEGAPVGAGFPPLLDVIIGITPGETSVDTEFAKAEEAARLGVRIVTDVSTSGDATLRRRIRESLPVAVRTVPTYDIHRAFKAGEDARDATRRVVREHVADGVDCITIHASGTNAGVRDEEVTSRVIPVTSRGGAMVNEISDRTGRPNCYEETFDELLDICAEAHVAISLATTSRPGSVVDALSASHVHEIERQGELARRAHRRGVDVVIELMGHVPLHLIAEYCTLAGTVLDGAPYGALGPCVTDVAMGHDDVSGAIGAAVAAMHGASFIACLTAGEHSHLPTHEELLRSIRSFQVALHAGWIAHSGDLTRDAAMSRARNANDWPRMVELSLHPEDSARIVAAAGYHVGQVCSMCGSSCPIVRTGAAVRQQG